MRNTCWKWGTRCRSWPSNSSTGQLRRSAVTLLCHRLNLARRWRIQIRWTHRWKHNDTQRSVRERVSPLRRNQGLMPVPTGRCCHDNVLSHLEPDLDQWTRCHIIPLWNHIIYWLILVLNWPRNARLVVISSQPSGEVQGMLEINVGYRTLWRTETARLSAFENAECSSYHPAKTNLIILFHPSDLLYQNHGQRTMFWTKMKSFTLLTYSHRAEICTAMCSSVE